jgi:hypothetical protein
MGREPILAQIPQFGKIQCDCFQLSAQVDHLSEDLQTVA